MTNKKYTLWELFTVNALSESEKKEAYLQFLAKINDPKDFYGTLLAPMWQRVLKGENAYTWRQTLKLWIWPIITMALLIVMGAYTNTVATLFFALCCFLPLGVLYPVFAFVGLVGIGSIVYSMKMIKEEFNF